LIEPAADIVIASTEAAFCTSITVTVGGVDV
jgi:phage-related baseplate assembly protein